MGRSCSSDVARFALAAGVASRGVDHNAGLDGFGLSCECATMWTDALPLHGTILPPRDWSGGDLWCRRAATRRAQPWLMLGSVVVVSNALIWWGGARLWVVILGEIEG